jgi:hypothetical protein
MLDLLIYLSPLLPFLSRGIVSAMNWQRMKEPVPAKVQDRETYRTLILTLAGFSFTGLLGVTVASTALGTNLDYTAYYLLFSFLSFIATLNIQSYKNFIWLDVLSDMFFDSAILTLILSVAVIIIVATFSLWVKTLVILGLIFWLVDHAIQLTHLYKDFRRRH